MTSNKSLLAIICLVLLSQDAFIFAQQDINLCTEPNPSPNNICAEVFEPVCAYRYVCIGQASCQDGETLENSCVACSQQGFDFYVNGTCPQDEKPENENEGEEYEMPDNIIWCPRRPPGEEDIVCSDVWEPVCAWFKEEEGSIGNTFRNACEACFVLHMDFYTPGVCEGYEEHTTEEENGPIPCHPFEGSEEQLPCPGEYRPVCAYRNDSEEGITFANSCLACALEGFDYFYLGTCESL